MNPVYTIITSACILASFMHIANKEILESIKLDKYNISYNINTLLF